MNSELLTRLADTLAPAYEVESELGRGGMAIVYRGRDTRLKRGVAIKLLPPDLAFRADIRTRFLREAEMSAKLSHPNIVSIYSVDERDGLVYFVMALVDGESVGDRLRRDGAMPIAESRRILREVADALAYAHAHGVVHRDIKPDNVLLDRASGRAMVTDFGIARAASEDDGASRLTATGSAIGTPAYMSPEQCAGDRDIDGRSDLYSLGTVAYQMLAGVPPFSGGNTPSIMMKQVTEKPVPLRQRRPDLPEDLERIVMRLLEKDPENRFVDGGALVAALDGAPLAPLAPLAASMPPAQSQSSAGPVAPAPQWGVDDVDDGRSSRKLDRATRRRLKREKKERPLSERVRRFRGQLINYGGTSVFLFGINYMTTNGHGFWWFVFPVLGMGLNVVREIGTLMSEGVSFKQLMSGAVPATLAAAPDSGGALGPATIPTATATATATASAPAPAPALAPGVNDDVRNGPFGGVLRQAMADQRSVNDLLSRMSDTERRMIPDVKGTADALFARVVSLAVALHRLEGQVGGERLGALDERIAQSERQESNATDRERRLALLRRQRDMLAELLKSRATLLEQYESAGLLLQNLALDLLKVRSSGLDSALSGLTSATQEARALSREIGYVLDAADELRDLGNASGTV
jgi:serine/threonine protein kinase